MLKNNNVQYVYSGWLPDQNSGKHRLYVCLSANLNMRCHCPLLVFRLYYTYSVEIQIEGFFKFYSFYFTTCSKCV